MNFWEKVKKDSQKGIEEGMTVIKEGAAVVKEKAEELTKEAKKHYRIYELKTNFQKWITELGGRVYELSLKGENPMSDVTVKLMLNRIKKLEKQITKLEEKKTVTSPKAMKLTNESKNK